VTPEERLIETRLAGSVAAVRSLAEATTGAAAAIVAVRDAARAGATIFTCGNGGSAAEALHLAEELVGRYREDREPLPAVCLNADATALTCIANDFGYAEVFSRQVEALAAPGDVLVALSTSGRSPNVVAALETARRMNVTAVGLLGKDGGDAAGLCDHAVVVPSDDTAHIQEAHLVLIHLMLEAVESAG